MKYLVVLLLVFLCLSRPVSGRSVVDSLMREFHTPGGDRDPALKLQLGIAYYLTDSYDSALLWLRQAIKAAVLERDSNTLIRSYVNIGNVYADRGDNPGALGYYQQALHLAESGGDPGKIAPIRKNIGALYVSWKRFDEALDYYNSALEQAVFAGDSGIVADCFNNLGTVYEQQQKYPEALAAYGRALEHYRKADKKGSVAMVLSNMAIVYKFRGNYAQSIAYNKQALEIAQESGDRWTEAATLCNIGSVYQQEGSYGEAMRFSIRAKDLASQIGAKEIIISAYDNMAGIAYASGDFKDAYLLGRELAVQKDSFINSEITRQLSELQVKYDTREKEQENARLRYENRLRTAEKEQAEKNARMTLMVVFTVVLGLGLILLLVYRIRRMRAGYREEQKISRAMFESEQNERTRIARDLHDSIGQMMSVIKMQVSQFHYDAEARERDRMQQTLDLVDQTIREVRHISHNLLPEGLNFGLIRALEELALKVNEAQGPAFQLTFHDDIREHAFSGGSELSIFRIIQEVTGNMLHHAEAGRIRLEMFKRNSTIVISLSDDGKGFDPAAIPASTGIGWKNTRLRVQFLNGTMQVRSTPEQGTHISISIPQ